MKTLYLSLIVGLAITLMLTSTYVILTAPHSTGPVGAMSPQMNNITNISTVIIPKDSENQNSGKNYQPDRFVVVLGINNTVTWINDADVGNTVVADNYDDPDFANATKPQSEGYMHLKLTNFLNPGKSFTYTFTTVGYFGFHGEPHPWLHGWVLVLPQDTENLTQTVAVNDTDVMGPCAIFEVPCPNTHIFTAQKFDTNIYIEKMTINGVDNYALVNPEGYCVYPPNSYRNSCTNPVDLALLRLRGADISNLSMTNSTLQEQLGRTCIGGPGTCP